MDMSKLENFEMSEKKVLFPTGIFLQNLCSIGESGLKSVVKNSLTDPVRFLKTLERNIKMMLRKKVRKLFIHFRFLTPSLLCCNSRKQKNQVLKQ